jgi:copper homeostasis protein (lipoprotein)
VFGAEDRRIALFGGTEAPLYFRLVRPDTLRKLDVAGNDIESDLNYELRRKDEIGTIEPRLTMRGMYRYMADAALFAECLTGRSFPVATEGDNIALERGYLEARSEPGETILVSLTGRIASRPKMEGDGQELVVVPERFGSFWPGETCGARTTRAELQDTYWKLTRLGDEPVIPADGQREPHLVLRSEGSTVTGFSGCNRLNGSFIVEGSSIEFTQMATTLMACAASAETERAFLAALGKADSWRLIGNHLDLLDSAGDMVARFEARYLK